MEDNLSVMRQQIRQSVRQLRQQLSPEQQQLAAKKSYNTPYLTLRLLKHNTLRCFFLLMARSTLNH